MKLRSKSSWAVAGLVAVATMLVGNGAATAGIIVSVANSTPVGDPFYEYYLQITVDGTIVPITTGDYLTVSGFIDLTSFSGAAAPSGWSTSDLNTNSSDGSVTFTYTGSSTITTDVVYPTGDFRVGLTSDVSTPPTPTLTYDAYTSSNVPLEPPGSITVTYVVPEPSSVALLSVGLGSLMLIWFRQKSGDAVT